MRKNPYLLPLVLLIVTALACSLPLAGAPPTATIEPPTAAPTPTVPLQEASATPTSQPTSAQPSPTVPPEPTRAPATTSQPDVSYEGISFSYDPSLASGVKPSTVAAVSGNDIPPWEIAPTTYTFEFTGYRLVGTFHQPHIWIYPVDEFARLSDFAQEQVDQLKLLLQQQPADPGDIPFLPIWNAAQMMQAKVRYLDFQSGSGVRFLTMYGQAAAPVNNYSLFYCFQGLTADGRYYISAVLPTSHPSLPNDLSGFSADDYNKIAEDFPNYITGAEKQLSNQPDESFTPSLALLDALVQSLNIAR